MKVKKMWMDGKPNQNPQDTSRANRNIINNRSLAATTNEQGNLLIDTFGEKKNQLGVIVLDNNDFIVFVKKADNHSEIGYVDSNLVYHELIVDPRLDFKYNNPITGEFQRNAKGELIVTFKDSNNVIKYFNKDKAIIFEDLNVFPDTKTPRLKSSLDIGGNLKSGAWYPIIRYKKEDLVTGSWTKEYNPVFITNMSINPLDADSLKTGTIPNVTTNKLIRLTLTNLDTRFKKLDIGVVFQANNTRVHYFVKTINIVSSTEVVVISRMDELLSLGTDPLIIIDRSKFKKAKHIAQLENTLYLVDLEKYKEPIQQKLFNNIQFNWKSTLIDFGPAHSSFKDNYINNQIRHFQHGEVYAVYAQLEYPWGWGQWWHCPGRLPSGDDNVAGEGEFQKYQSTDTCAVDGTLSFWENENEFYPATGYYPSGKVRHIKFPSIKWMRENIYGNDDYYGSRKMDILNLQIRGGFNLANFKDGEGNQAINYRLGYARRDDTSGLIVGQTIFVGSSDFTGDAETVNGSVGFNANITNYNSTSLSTTNIRTYDFNALFNKATPAINYIRSEVILHAQTLITSFKNADLNYNDIRYGVSNFYANTTALVPRELTKVNRARFVINNTLLDNIDNRYLEDNINLDLAQSLFLPPLASLTGADWGSPVFYTHLITLLSLKKNCYVEFFNQSIIPCDEDKQNNSFGGDTYFGVQNVNTFGTTGRKTYSTDPQTHADNNIPQNGTRIAHQFISESKLNLDFRFVDPGANSAGNTYYAPYSDPSIYLVRMRRDLEANLIARGYSQDYNAQNNLQATNIFNPNSDIIYNDKFLVTRGSPIAEEVNDINTWLNFKLNDVYHLNKTSGEVVNVVAGKDYLIFHHKNALYRTRVRTYIDTTGDAAFTGQGDIFDNEPELVMYDKTGALGTQHKYSCYMSKFGYFWLDSEVGSFYQYNGQEVKDIGANGLRRFFQNNAECAGDNPFNSYGFHTVVDQINNRLLVTKKSLLLKEEYKKRFKGVWKDEENFLNSLNIGDIVLKDGKYVIVQ